VTSGDSAARTNDGSPLNLTLPEATSQADLSTIVCWQPPAVPKGLIVSYTLLVDSRVAYSGLALCTSLGVLQPDTGYRLVRVAIAYSWSWLMTIGMQQESEVCNALGCTRTSAVVSTADIRTKRYFSSLLGLHHPLCPSTSTRASLCDAWSAVCSCGVAAAISTKLREHNLPTLGMIYNQDWIRQASKSNWSRSLHPR
jgi:hypothetical protein